MKIIIPSLFNYKIVQTDQGKELIEIKLANEGKEA